MTSESATTGATSSQRVQTNLTIRVKNLDFDPQAGQLHVSGRIDRENRYTKLGQYHTIDLELNRNFTLEKEVGKGDGQEGWDSVARAQLDDAVSEHRGTEAVAVVMHEGAARICFVTQSQTIVKQEVIEKVGSKRQGEGRTTGGKMSAKKKAMPTKHDSEVSRFFKKVLQTLMRQVERLEERVQEEGVNRAYPILLAGPGWTARQFLSYITEEAVRGIDKLLQALVKRNSFVVVHSSSGNLHSLQEVLASQQVKSSLKDTKYARETALMDEFFALLRKEEGRAWYGPKECEAAVAEGAVGKGGGVLLISNGLFRSQDVVTRRRWVKLVDQVKDVHGGEVRVLSNDHESGKRLEGIGGIAAILTYPIHELEDDEEQIDNKNGAADVT